MRYSEFLIKTSKNDPSGEESINAKLLIRAGFIDKVMAGVYNFLPLGLKTLKKIENVIREEMVSLGAKELLMPALQPKENWMKTKRFDAYDTLFRFTSFYSKTDYVLGPTHEEIISPLAKKFISSYRDLPKSLFQIQTKFRDEKRAKAGLLRGREFLMKDLYSFHASDDDLDNYYDKVSNGYERIFIKAGIGQDTYLTFASGGTFSKYSHEFQTMTPAGEDTINICKKCHIAVNEEIITEQSSCPQCASKDLKTETAVEVGNIFKLKTKYSKPFNLCYKNESGAEKPVIMGCYGIGLNRLMGTIVEKHHDDNGIIWPKSVAPFKLYLISLDTDNSDVKNYADKLYKELDQAKIEVLYDDRGASAGEKFADADLIGIPFRAVISKKMLAQNKIEIKKRSVKKTELIERAGLEKYLNLN